MSNKNYLEIDGSLGEGGGAILRLSVAYSFLFKKPIIIKNIRANRPNPGLRLQHLLGLKTLADLTNSKLSNCHVGTEEITFIPNIKNEIKSNISLNINTAASIGLLLQPIQIACLGFKKPEKIEIKIRGGGTFGKWAPGLNYLKAVTYKIFEASGLKFKIDILKHGFYPKGGAQVNCYIYPPQKTLNPINLTELGNVERIHGDIIITNQLRRNRANIGIRIRKTIQQRLKRDLNVETDIKFTWVDSISPGVGVTLWAQSDKGGIISTGTILGDKKTSSEKLGNITAQKIISSIQNEIPIDNYLSDQLIPLMAYIEEKSCIKVSELTNHTKTNLELTKRFTKKDYEIVKFNNFYKIHF
ncbi:MAG: RNA 3'-phosphate cyclase [Candidatus Lokiarchaeota archaeon]|nr:RNA 3'-phosphate cyclase [Candidatus Lokiarchaeota archaeon]